MPVLKSSSQIEQVRDAFLKDVAEHEVRILKDDEVYRQVVFQKPGTSIFHFVLTTWPGHLCISGDMGCYVFTRGYRDMFFFFCEDESELRINPGYWSQKVIAQDRFDGMKVWSPELFRENIREWIKDEFEGAPEDLLEKALESVKPIIDSSAETEYEAIRAIDSWDDPDGLGINFEGIYDFWESGNYAWTYRFLWCCFAIVWGIAQYNKVKSDMASSGHLS